MIDDERERRKGGKEEGCEGRKEGWRGRKEEEREKERKEGRKEERSRISGSIMGYIELAKTFIWVFL